MQPITVNVSLYGSIAKFAGGHHIAQVDLEIDEGSSIGDLLDKIVIPAEEKGFLFRNAILCDIPGLNVSRGELLQDGDHIGIFSEKHMWPYLYRDGIRMSDSLSQALKEQGALHHTYHNAQE